MFRKFTEGLAFGCGFGISFIVLWFIATYLITPMLVENKFNKTVSHQPSSVKQNAAHHYSNNNDILPGVDSQHREPSLEERIKQSSVIIIAKYEPAPDGKMKAIIKEFLKKDDSVELYYKVGDEYPETSYYPKENWNYGDGQVIFLTGSPAMITQYFPYFGNRIPGLGDMPLELLRKKCKTS